MQTAKPLVPIVYHCFPHYRGAVNRQLMRSKKYEYLFAGGTEQYDNIPVWEISQSTPFLRTHNTLLGSRVLLQNKVLGLALRRDVQAIIFLGEAAFLTTWLAASAARLTGKKVFFWTHGWTSPDTGPKTLIRRAFYRIADDLLLYGHHAKQIGIQAGFQREHMHVVYNSMDYSAQKVAREAVMLDDLAQVRRSLFGARSHFPILLSIGRLISMRGLELLLDAMRILEKNGFPVNLLLVGDGPERAKLKAVADCNRLSVLFYGPCYNEESLAPLFMSADLLVMPGRIGLAAIHSLAYGTPVLTHNNANDQGPEHEAVIPGFNGALFAHNDSGTLARAVYEWFQRAPRRDLVSRCCHEVVERFYSPIAQAGFIERALEGKPADDSPWDRFIEEAKTCIADPLANKNSAPNVLADPKLQFRGASNKVFIS